MFRIAILSFWHVHAQDYAREAEAHPGTEIAAVYDEEPRANRAYARRPNRSCSCLRNTRRRRFSSSSR